MSVSLAALESAGLGKVVRGDASTKVSGVQHDSRAVRAGDLFVAVRGAKSDGAEFAKDALARGATALAAESALEGTAPLMLVPNARIALSKMAEHVYGHPTGALDVVGITGTNGKTTTAWIVESLLAQCGGRPALMGTVLTRAPGIERVSAFTTPEGDDLARFVREAVDAGATHLVMEVSSHALALHRVEAVRFRVAAFTNLTQDHLDFHGTIEAYGEAKARLFRELGPEVSVVHVGDAFGAKLAASIPGRVLRCSADEPADIYVEGATSGREGLRGTLVVEGRRFSLESPLIGRHNLENLVVAVGCAHGLGLDLDRVVAAIATAKGAPGRLERVRDDRDVAVLVDYAHTPDALARALAAVRPITPGRLFVVFGCGGDRDRGKRPLMGEAAGGLADLCVVTSDNPRTEDPDAIVDAILPGVMRAGKAQLSQLDADRGFVRVVDRAQAIEAALTAARSGDTVLIAGKGHEDYQIVGIEKRHFDDREIAASVIARLAGGA